jgi:hypothetical protein
MGVGRLLNSFVIGDLGSIIFSDDRNIIFGEERFGFHMKKNCVSVTSLKP